jgi:hypothetical protein
MHHYIEACAGHDNARRLGRLLDEIIPEVGLHARFVNTLSRLEYVGVRKMLKSRRADRLDLDGLQHVLDEAVHALRLKKAALALAAVAGTEVATFAGAHTLAGDAGERYFQTLDHRAEGAVADLGPADRVEANYLLTSAAIEVRAQVFYPLYDRRLAAHRAGFSVAAITKDEDRHLGEMKEGLARVMTDWRARLAPVLAAEEALFAEFLGAMEAAVVGIRAA